MDTNKSSGTGPFILGLVLGILASAFLPKYVRPILPQWMAGKENVVRGTVTAKQKQESALLLTVNTSGGVLLATFKEKIDEINLLVNEKDEIEFTLAQYVPFVEEPKIIRVVKEKPTAPEPSPPPGAATAQPSSQN
jgi:hypothetical protein